MQTNSRIERTKRTDSERKRAVKPVKPVHTGKSWTRSTTKRELSVLM